LHGAVSRGLALACAEVASGDDEGMMYFQFAPVSGGPVRRSPYCSRNYLLPLRWQLGREDVWVNCRYWSPNRGVLESVFRYRLADLRNGRLVHGRGAREGVNWADPFCGAGPVNEAMLLAGCAEFDPVHLWWAYLPVAEDQVLQFVLFNVDGPFKRVGGKAGGVGAIVTTTGAKEFRRPRWTFKVHRWRTTWDAKAGRWKGGKWSFEESIEVGFKEPFQALARGSDYYFLTRSGKLYRAPKAPKGKPRPLLRVWAEDGQPIKAFLQDADAGKTYLFCPPGRKGGKPVYFELGPRPRPLGYDPALFRPDPKVPVPLRDVLAYAQVLVALKKVKVK
jgi:hypothetical protein